MLKSVRLRNRASGKDVVIGRGSKPVLIEVEPGAYYLRRIDTGYFNVASMRVPEPELYFELQPGRVNYIGDLVIALTERPHLNVSWDFAASEETLREAAARQPGAFREPALWVRPGVEPVPIVLELEQPQVPAGESN
ncbi:MAG TPA: hypothetical protein VFT98_19715 [Myxococcota bacterium]|nr:hypothetical protein [Myxococcota bacterium]